MAHYLLFKQNVDAGEQSAAAKERDKTLRALAKERQKIMDEERAAHDKEQKQKKRAAMHNQRSASMVGPGCFSADGSDRDSASPSPGLSPSVAESPLLLELRKNWAGAHKVVFKDLPRLAKRTSVQTESHGVVIEAGRIVRNLQQRPPAPLSASASSSASASPPAAASASSSSSSSSSSAIPTGLNVRAASISFSRGAAPNDPTAASPSGSSSYTALSNPAPGTSPLPSRRGTTGMESWKGTMVVRKHNKKVWQEKWEANKDAAEAPSPAAAPAAAMSPGVIAAANASASPKSPLSVVSPSPKHGSAPSQELKQPAASPSAKSAAAVALPSSPHNAAAPAASSSSSSSSHGDDKSASLARSQIRSHSMIVSPSTATGLSAPFHDLSLSVGEVDTWQAVCNVVLTCIELLEPTEVLGAARNAFAVAASSMGPGSDHQGLLEDIFAKSIGLHSKTFRIFQAIHQSILFPAIAFLHENLYKKMQTPNMKDVRRGDGWTINVFIGPAIYITHQRWEQNLLPESDPRHFEVRWEMRLSFDRNMEQLRAVILRIQELTFHEESTPAFRSQIRDVLAGSGYIV